METEKLFKTPLGPLQLKNSALNHLECTEGKMPLRSYPRRLVFELTNRCNYQCIMCGREAVDFKTSDLPASIIKSCSTFLKHAEEVTLHGWGEGTLHPELGSILEYLNTYPLLRKYFVTNGSTLPKIMEDIFTHHVDLVALSLDGATPATNDSIRKGGNLEREIRSVKRLLAEKKERGLDYPYVNFVFTAMKSNIHEVSEMVELAASIGVPEVKVVYLTIFNEHLAAQSLYGRQEMVKESFDRAGSLASELGIKLKLPEIQGRANAGDLSHKPCAFPWRDFFIGSDCFIRPCQSSAEKLLDLRDFADPALAWNSRAMQDMRGRINDEKRMSKNCRLCYHSSCANVNLRSSFIQLGQEFAPEWSVQKGFLGSRTPVRSAITGERVTEKS